MPDELQPAGTASEPEVAEGATEAPVPAKKAAARKTAAKKAAVKKTAAKKTTTRKTAAKKAAAPEAGEPTLVDLPVEGSEGATAAEATEGPAQSAEPAEAPPAKKTARKTAKKAAAKKSTRKTAASKAAADDQAAASAVDAPTDVPADVPADVPDAEPLAPPVEDAEDTEDTEDTEGAEGVTAPAAPMVLFQAPEPTKKAAARRTRKTTKPAPEKTAAVESAPEAAAEAETPEAVTESEATESTTTEPKATEPKGKAKGSRQKRATKAADQEQAAPEAGEEDAAQQAAGAESTVAESTGEESTSEETAAEDTSDQHDGESGEGGSGRRRRRRGGRRRRKSGDSSDNTDSGHNGDQAGQGDGDQGESAEAEGGKDSEAAEKEGSSEQGEGGEGSSRRRRRRRRSGDDSGESSDDPSNTVTRVRRQRSAEDEITAVSGSTRLEAKKQRRREGREAGRRRAPIVSEAEFLARRESVDRVMVVRQRDELTQIGVLEDKVLVEHYVARESQTSLIGNVYLGRVQNVLPSMEAAFIDIGKGRNAVLYAGEVNWSALGHREGQPRKIESVLTSGQPVLVQVTKDPIGHKGARLTSQISLAGRFLVYVPDGTTSGISRKLPDTERNRLKALLKEIVPDTAGVIVRTAAEGASEEELTRDVERLKARWEDIEKNSKSGSAPKLLYGEPDLTLKVVRDLFTEDFSKLVIQGDDAWDTVQGYVAHVAPDLEERLERYDGSQDGKDVFATYRIDEQIAKGLDRKVWLPSGGSLIIDRTEAMTVVDVNTGKFTGSGGNLEETVTKNNLEAAEEIVRQLRLRDIGGIIVVDFIDMVLESNRDLVLRRLVECLGRDRTRHQVAEVTSLGLVQMTRKRIGTGLLEAFSENCEHCHGRGLIVKDAPVEPKKTEDESRRGGRRSRGGRGRGSEAENGQVRGQDDHDHGHDHAHKAPSPKDVAAMAKEHAERPTEDAAHEIAPQAGAPAAAEQAAAEPAQKQAQKQAEKRAQKQTGKRDKQRAEQDAAKPAQQEAAQPAEQGGTEQAQPEQTERAQQGEQTQPETPAEPARPQVVTRTRTRRAASRPAGQPERLPTPEPIVVEATAPEPVASAEPVTPAEPPKVVTRTRTRGRRATRPAGPPTAEPSAATTGSAGSSSAGTSPTATGAATTTAESAPPGSLGSVGAPPLHGAVEPGTAVAEPGPTADGAHPDEAHPVEHVPIKKKGSRKR